MSDLMGSADWIKLRDNLCAITGHIHLVHFQYCAVRAAPEECLKLYAVLGSKAGSLRVETMQCSLARVWLKECCLVEIFSRKWLSVRTSELVHT